MSAGANGWVTELVSELIYEWMSGRGIYESTNTRTSQRVNESNFRYLHCYNVNSKADIVIDFS